MDGKQIYYFTNSTKKAVDTKVSIRGKWKIYRCNPHTWSIESWNNVEHYKDNNGLKLYKIPIKVKYGIYHVCYWRIRIYPFGLLSENIILTTK